MEGPHEARLGFEQHMQPLARLTPFPAVFHGFSHEDSHFRGCVKAA